jgi:hypothetical protein
VWCLPKFLAKTVSRKFQFVKGTRSRHSSLSSSLGDGSTLARTCGALLITFMLPSEAWLLSVSRTRENFSASPAASTGGSRVNRITPLVEDRHNLREKSSGL